MNSKALELAGVTKDTPDPFGGEIDRKENGEPKGFLYEEAVSLVAKYALDLSEAQEKQYLKLYMDGAAEMGITSVVDVQPYFGQNLGTLDVYSDMEQQDDLTVRITAAADLLGDLDQALENRRKYRSDKVHAHMLKQFVDGVINSYGFASGGL